MIYPISKKAHIVLVLCLSVIGSSAQLKPLSITDKVPELKFENIINVPFSSVSLSQLKGKVVIIDFWHTGCGGCIKKMPLTAKLQEQFKRQIQIIMVTKQPKSEVEVFYNRRKELKQLGLATLVHDTFLHKIFPYHSNPHLVWIGKDRIVKAITDAQSLNAENISLLLKNNKIELAVKSDWLDSDFKMEEILLTYGQPITDQLLCNSTLTGKIDNVSRQQMGIRNGKDFVKIRLMNSTISRLYSFAYSRRINLTGSNWKTRVRSYLSDSAFFDKEPGHPAKYCYELSVAKSFNSDEKKVFSIMQKDLDRLFNIKSSVKNILRECYVLYPITKDNGELYNPENDRVWEHLDSTRFVKATPHKLAGAIQNLMRSELPVIYEGSEKRPITITLKNLYTSREELEFDLLKIGIGIKKDKRFLDTVVFEENELGLTRN